MKPIRNVPKLFLAQYREFMADILADHAEAARQADFNNQRRLGKAFIILLIFLHNPPDKCGIFG